MRVTIALGLVALIVLPGCGTDVKVKKFTGEEDGIRYSLPQPFLIARPGPDGGVSFKVEYLPDPDNTYAVEASSFMAAYTLDLALEDGLLKSVTFDASDTKVAEQFAKSAGPVAEAAITASAEAAKARAQRIEAAAKAVRDAETEVRVLEAELAEYTSQNDTVKIRATEAKLAIARARLDAARRELRIVGAKAFTMDVDEGPLAWGPVVYRIVETAEGVKLEPIKWTDETTTQMRFGTSSTPKQTTPSEPSVSVKDSSVIVPDAKGLLRFTIEVAGPALRKVDGETIRLNAHRPTLTLQKGGATIAADLAPTTPDGHYTLTFDCTFLHEGLERTVSRSIDLEVRRPR